MGGDAPISVQSMTNTPTADTNSTLRLIMELADAGCDIVRVGVPDGEAAEALPEIVSESPLPVVADIHFDYALALSALDANVAGLRINPGTLGAERKVREVASAAAQKNVPVRVGVNAGSLEGKVRSRMGGITPEALVESALKGAKILSEEGVEQIKISVKASSVPLTIMAYRLVAKRCDYPLHLGVSEAGTTWSGTIKSAIGIGTLLAEGLGDTIRVSLTASPVEEVRVGVKILRTLGLRVGGIDVISCPTCARMEMNVIGMAQEVERRLSVFPSASLKVAVMGCEVNGPGEAREADVGIAGGRTGVLLFREGRLLKKVSPESAVEELVSEVEDLLKNPPVGGEEKK